MPTFQPLSLVAAADRDRAMRALVAGASRLPTRWVSGPEEVAHQDKLHRVRVHLARPRSEPGVAPAADDRRRVGA